MLPFTLNFAVLPFFRVTVFLFKYVFLCPDTPATTYHIEFRYGSDLTTATFVSRLI
jgi:hypothetical protein